MSADRKPFQNNGFQNHLYQGGMVPPRLNTEQSLQSEPLATTSLIFEPVIENSQKHVERHDHAVHMFSTDYKYQPITWNVDCSNEAELMAVNLYEDNQNYIYWNDPFNKGNFTQLAPSVNPYTSTSVMQDISSPYVSVKQNHQIEDMHSTTKPLLMSNDEKSKESQVCPICGRTFVYQLNFAKHMAAAGCCEPPCKKTRMDPEPDMKETFKCNTLPRASRSKKITRSNSTKSRKRQTSSLNSHLPEYLPNSEIPSDFQKMTTSTCKDSKILQTTLQRPVCPLVTSEATSQTRIQQESTYCSFCKLQLNSENHYQRHRLAHALVIQLTRCLVLSQPIISFPNNETGNNSAVLSYWLSDQIRININDENWVRLSVQEVEQVLGNSNMDVDIPQRHGIQDNAGFQNIVDLLVTQDLNLTPGNEFTDATRISDFIPQETANSVGTTGTLAITYDPFPVHSLCHSSDPPMIVPNLPVTEVTSPIYQTSAIEMSDVAGCTSLPNFYDYNQPEGSFKSIITDIDFVERQMASLLKTYESTSPTESGRNLTQTEMDFQHICNGHDMFEIPHIARTVEYPYTFKVNVEFANPAGCKTLPVLGDIDRLTYKLDRSVRSTTPEEEENLTY